MKVVTEFWQKYASGGCPTISSLSRAVRTQRAAQNATDTTFERFLGDDNLDVDTFNAPKRLAFPAYMSSSAMLRYHERADYQHVDYRLMLFGATLIENLRKSGIPMYVHSAFRTATEQDALFYHTPPRSQLMWPRAPHCQGFALDIVHGKYHWDLTPDEWKYVGKVGQDIAAKLRVPYRPSKDGKPSRPAFNIEWGGTFSSFYDPAHWQVSSWANNIIKPVIGDPVRLTPRAILKR